jgi:hypothetical protein
LASGDAGNLCVALDDQAANPAVHNICVATFKLTDLCERRLRPVGEATELRL